MLTSAITIHATAKPGVKPEQLEKAMEEEIARLQKDGPTEAEVERARNKIETDIISRLERLGGFGGVADRLNYYNHYLGDPGYLPKDLARFDHLTPASIKAFAATLTPNSRVVVYGVPGEKKIDDVPKREDAEAKKPAPAPPKDTPEQAWRATPPKPSSAITLNLPVPQTFKLANGMTVLVVERHNLPVLATNLLFLGGNAASSTPGLGGFTASMLQEGTEKRNALQIADDADQIGATLATGSGFDSSNVGIFSLSKNVDPAFELLSDVALHPAFRNDDIERIRKIRLTNLIQQKDEPQVLVNKFVYREIYGTKHPYGFLESGTEESTKSVTRDNLVDLYKSVYAPSNSALVLAGDITVPEARKLAEKYFGAWNAKAATPVIPNPPSAVQRHILLINKPGANQTNLRVASLGVSRTSPDFVPIQVMNLAFGGLFSSRVNLNLREAHGYTYGAFSFFSFRRGAGPFAIGGAIRTDVTAPAISEIFKEVDRMRSEPPSAEELAMAKDAYARSLAGNFEEAREAAATIGNLFVYGLPLDYYRTLPSKIDAVTAADVSRVARERLTPESMVVVGVGDVAKIQPEITKLNLGSVVAVDSNGDPIGDKKESAAVAK
jgi:zinc protease